MEHVASVASQFQIGGIVTDVQRFGAGNVNDTYLVSVESQVERQFVLQRINQHVFPRPDLVMSNMRRFSEHVLAHQQAEGPSHERRWEVPRVIQTEGHEDYVVDTKGEFWRMLNLIADAQTHIKIIDASHAQECGYALGQFQMLISDLDVNQLHDTLEGFHILPQYLARYDHISSTSSLTDRVRANRQDVQFGMNFIEERRQGASMLEEAKAEKWLSVRAIHGDPKVDNILIDNRTKQAISIIDLDTVKPGLVHYDVGDCLRSCCNPAGEETNTLDDVRFDTDLCQAILQGYLPVVRRFFQEADYAYLYDSIRLIAFELGLRFFTDYLAGDVYFKARYPEHNLQRALVQFRLAESIESQQKEISLLINENR